jgi:hypothetical protein
VSNDSLTNSLTLLSIRLKKTVGLQRKKESNVVLRRTVLWEEGAQQALLENSLLQ